jgi:hypothetical protein
MQLDEMKMDFGHFYVVLDNKIINISLGIYPTKIPGCKSQVEFVR